MRPLPSSKHDDTDGPDEQVVAVCADDRGGEVTFPAEDIEIEPVVDDAYTNPVVVTSDTPGTSDDGIWSGRNRWYTKEIRFERRTTDPEGAE